jgi:hypothetical protein
MSVKCTGYFWTAPKRMAEVFSHSLRQTIAFAYCGAKYHAPVAKHSFSVTLEKSLIYSTIRSRSRMFESRC